MAFEESGRFIAVGLGVAALAFAIAAIVTKHWMETGTTDFGLWEINDTNVRDVNCGGNGECETGIRKTKATSAMMIIGAVFTLAAICTAWINNRLLTLNNAVCAAVFFLVAVAVYGSIDRDGVFGSAEDADLKYSYGLALIALILSAILAGAARFLLPAAK